MVTNESAVRDRRPVVTFDGSSAELSEIGGVSNKSVRSAMSFEAKAKADGMRYTITDVPPLHIALILGCQQWLTMIGATIISAFVVTPLMGATKEQTAHVISTLFVVAGINTLVQTTIGDRLPIVQGASFSFLTPILAIISNPSLQAIQDDNERFEKTMRVVSGAVFVSGLVGAFVGYTGLIVPLFKYISPVSIAPVITIIGLSLYSLGIKSVATCWPVGLMQIFLTLLFSQYLKFIKVFGSPIFCLFPVIIACGLTWSYAAIMTASGVYEEGSQCRTDGARKIIADAPWFRVPYPGQWGGLDFEVWAIFPMFGALVAVMMESTGDYYSCARLSGAPPPTPGIISRGLGAEGLGLMMAGLFGTSSGTTSYAENIAAIAITRVGSRVVVQTAALFMIVAGLCTKISALIAAWPTALVGGIYCIMFGLIAAVGLSNLQYINLNAERNLFILGFSLYNALSVAGPAGYFASQPSNPFGDSTLAAIAYSIFSSPIMIALMCAVFLDNTISGTPKDRGLNFWRKVRDADVNNDPEYLRVYALPRRVGKVTNNCGHLEYFSMGHMPAPPKDGVYKPGRADLGELCCPCWCPRPDDETSNNNDDDENNEENS